MGGGRIIEGHLALAPPSSWKCCKVFFVLQMLSLKYQEIKYLCIILIKCIKILLEYETSGTPVQNPISHSSISVVRV